MCRRPRMWIVDGIGSLIRRMSCGLRPKFTDTRAELRLGLDVGQGASCARPLSMLSQVDLVTCAAISWATGAGDLTVPAPQRRADRAYEQVRIVTPHVPWLGTYERASGHAAAVIAVALG